MTDALHSPASILRRVADPVDALGLELVPRELLPPLLKRGRDRLRQQPGLFGQVSNCQADQFESIHNSGVASARSIFFGLA